MMYGGWSVSRARTRRHTWARRILGLQRLQGLGAILGRRDLVAPVPEHARQQEPRGHIVFGDEDPHGAPPFSPNSSCSRLSSASSSSASSPASCRDPPAQASSARYATARRASAPTLAEAPLRVCA